MADGSMDGGSGSVGRERRSSSYVAPVLSPAGAAGKGGGASGGTREADGTGRRGSTASLVDVDMGTVSGGAGGVGAGHMLSDHGGVGGGTGAGGSGGAPPAVLPTSGAAVAGTYNSTRDVVVMGLGFWLIFTAFQTSSFFQASVLEELGFGDSLAFSGAALLYATFCVALFFVSKIIAVLGARRSMFLGSCCYALFVATLVHVIRPVFILGSMLDGVGAAMLWTSQGNLLTRFSSEAKRNRNSAIFNSFMQGSLLTGSVTAYVLVPPGSELSPATAQRLFIVLLIVAVCGSCTLLLVRQPPPLVPPPVADPPVALPASQRASGGGALQSAAAGGTTSSLLHERGPSPGARGVGGSDALRVAPRPAVEASTGAAAVITEGPTESVWQSVVATVRTGCTRRVAMVNLLLATNGLGLSFYQGKYPQIVAGKDPLAPDLPEEFQPRLIAFVMVCIGVSEIAGGIICDRWAHKLGAGRMVWIGLVAQIVSLVTIYINLLSGLVTPSVYVAFACALLLGFGDAIIVILAYAMFGRIFKGGNTKVFALMFFAKSSAAGVAFGYSHVFPLVPLVFMLAALNIPAGICFAKVDRETLHMAGAEERAAGGGDAGSAWMKLDDGPDRDPGGVAAALDDSGGVGRDTQAGFVEMAPLPRPAGDIDSGTDVDAQTRMRV